MSRLFDSEKDFIVLSCKKEELCCGFILKEGFTEGVLSSRHYHFHSTYELHVPISGILHIVIGDRDLLVHPGEVCVIPPGVIHYIFADAGTFRTGFRFAYAWEHKNEKEQAPLFAKAFGAMKEACVVPDCRIYEKYVKAGRENLAGGFPGFMTAELLFLALFEVALKLQVGEAEQEAGGQQELVDLLLSEKVEQYLNDHYQEVFSLGDLAAYLNFSSRQTERILERLYGLSFSALVNKKRLVVAKLLLRSTDLTVGEVAEQVGFRDVNYFYRKFGEAFEITPGQYRVQQKETVQSETRQEETACRKKNQVAQNN